MPSVDDVIVITYPAVWDVATLSRIPQQQALLVADTVTVGAVTVSNMISSVETGLAKDTSLGKTALTIASGAVNSSGNNTLLTPSSGKALRCTYLSYNPSLAVEAAFRFGTNGALFLRNNLTTAGAVIAKDFGDFRYVQGAVNEALILNLSLAVSTIWNAFYVEI